MKKQKPYNLLQERTCQKTQEWRSRSLTTFCKKQPAKKPKNEEAEDLQPFARSSASRKSSLSPIRLQKNKLEARVHYVYIIHINNWSLQKSAVERSSIGSCQCPLMSIPGGHTLPMTPYKRLKWSASCHDIQERRMWKMRQILFVQYKFTLYYNCIF